MFGLTLMNYQRNGSCFKCAGSKFFPLVAYQLGKYLIVCSLRFGANLLVISGRGTYAQLIPKLTAEGPKKSSSMLFLKKKLLKGRYSFTKNCGIIYVFNCTASAAGICVLQFIDFKISMYRVDVGEVIFHSTLIT